ncbi:hypothetical protein [Pseudomonas oryzihabitans]|uniref:hypothetical protein n=1 Tax=Pseudomonas oryzihabitans TaxID=47885 RepID=UPI002866C7A5|nr:hypothetical protein [Pseudomonas psychrotolerans]MDR6679495.1 ABC-type transport system involved in multi-copper enzyme maturation permease subunit [Pseudomonas psychrotolerans]
MVEGLASSFGLGLFAVCVQILALLSVSRTRSGKTASLYALAFVLTGCVMVGMVMFDPSAFARIHIDGIPIMAACH